MIIINGKSMNPPTKKGDKYQSIKTNTPEVLTVKSFRASNCEGDFNTLQDCKEKYPNAELYYVVNEEYDGWSDVNYTYAESKDANIIIQGVGNSNITINFS